MAQFVGIDLGTTFSVISVFDDTGRPKIVHNKDGENITPSCVAEEGGVYTVGTEPRKAWRTAYSVGEAAGCFKRDMGEDKTHVINGKEFTPTELSAKVLKKLAQDAVAQIGEIGEAVVTIPANFGNKAREATMAAAKAAGLNVRYIINEPTAAALYYSFKEDGGMRGVYAVYDLGGGTFDVSIVRVDGFDVEVLATGGVRHLGGEDFDKALIKIVGEKYKRETGEDMARRDYDLKAAEDDKKSLSNRQTVDAEVNRELIGVTRKEFEEAISSLVTQAEMLCESAMEEAKIAPSGIRGVLLAGGSTRIPLIKESVARIFGQEPIFSVNVDEVVSLGATLYAAYKGDQSQLSPLQKRSVQKIGMTERTSKFYGTTAISRGERDKLVNVVLIPKGERIPCSASDSFYTLEGQESVECDVTESDAPETDPDFVVTVWRRLLDLPPGRPAKQEIKVIYSYDENQIMHCSFEDAATGKKLEKRLSMTRADTGEDIGQFEVE